MSMTTTPTEIREHEGRPVAVSMAKMRLVVVDGPDAGQEIVVGQETVNGGTFRGCDLVLTDRTVSRYHFEIRVLSDGFLLCDLDSTNGVYLDGYRARQVFLKAGSVFEAGSTSIRFEPLEERIEIPLSEKDSFGLAVGTSVKMREVFGFLERVAPTELTVLIQGETGTGKEVIARSIHMESRRAQAPFVVVDCAALPANLIESELFGHKKGAFTGAVESRRGAFELAHRGTLFLDELGELPLELQPKLLRVLEERKVRRVGGEKETDVDVRVIAATNRELARMVADETFREDLYFRLNVATVQLPPLRERPDDIPHLVERFVANLSESFAEQGLEKMPGVTARALEALTGHYWPGNVRELRNTVERAVYLSENGRVDVDQLRIDTRGGTPAILPKSRDLALPFKEAKARLVSAFERAYLVNLMERHQGNLSSAAREADIERKYLRQLLQKHELSGS